uniref:MYB family protein n=1 Tax=Populus trichocarpa TaxID=3694 RepID=A9PGA2_POPTR|nr:unknown [Populus trichocarpa]
MMPRSCSQCGNNGHNSRTCGESPAGGDQSSSTGIMLFGVRVTEVAASFRKSYSMNNLSQYDEQPHEEPNADVAAGYESDDVVHASGRSRERKRGVPWTEEEHKLFLLGLQKIGKGDWRGISRNFVKTRTPTQVASHAQKYFLRRNNQNRRRRRSSLFDITTDTFMGSSMEEDQVHQETATPALPQLQLQPRPCLNNNRPGGFPMSTFPVTAISPVTSPVSGDNPLEKLTSGQTNVNKKSSKLVRPVPIVPIPPSSKMADLNLNQKSPEDQFPALSLKLSTPSSEEQQQSPPASTHSSTFQAISSSDSIISVA